MYAECKDYTTYAPEYCTSRIQFYNWLQNCTCGCTVGNCIHCKKCQGCCRCHSEIFEMEYAQAINAASLETSCTTEPEVEAIKPHSCSTSCQKDSCANRYLLGQKNCFVSKRFIPLTPEVLGDSSEQGYHSWTQWMKHCADSQTRSVLPIWNILQQDVAQRIIDMEGSQHMFDDQVIKLGMRHQLCLNCNVDTS